MSETGNYFTVKLVDTRHFLCESLDRGEPPDSAKFGQIRPSSRAVKLVRAPLLECKWVKLYVIYLLPLYNPDLYNFGVNKWKNPTIFAVCIKERYLNNTMEKKKRRFF